MILGCFVKGFYVYALRSVNNVLIGMGSWIFCLMGSWITLSVMLNWRIRRKSYLISSTYDFYSLSFHVKLFLMFILYVWDRNA